MYVHHIAGQLRTKTRYLCAQKCPELCILVYNTLPLQRRYVNHIWVESYNLFRQFSMHLHITGEEIGTRNRYLRWLLQPMGTIFLHHSKIDDTVDTIRIENRHFRVQKCYKYWILVYNILTIQIKLCKSYMSRPRQTIGRICDCLHARTRYWWPATDGNQVFLWLKVPTIVHIGI